MDKVAELRNKMRQVVGANPNLPISGTVAEVTGETCTVQLLGGLKVTDVKLKSVVSEADQELLIVPADNSKVLLISADGTLRNLYVIKVDQVKQWILKTGSLQIQFDGSDNKVLVKNEQTGLYQLFELLVELLKQFKVYTPTGPSGTPLPDTILSIEVVETKFKQLLKES